VTASERIRLIIAAVVATMATAIVLGLDIFATDTVVAVYIVVLGGIALLGLTALARGGDQTESSLFELSLRRPKQEHLRPAALIRIERELVLGIESAGHLHTRLRPVLREAAAARLAAKRQIDLEADPRAARDVLGDEAWELLRPDRPEPAARNAPGISRAKLRAIVDVLEDI
jgi:hypothetical protein